MPTSRVYPYLYPYPNPTPTSAPPLTPTLTLTPCQMRAIIEARNESEMLEVLTRSLEKDLDERESALNVARAA